ncbi:MAG: bifunctional precorrin-2 dehydrogenase/sirohydrochlorin ferrochelatase [Syntrophomonadaceae bacterium]|nr:bifunctional precorrin-2 dehydrogenase/sirohydrochlorin ferrochelatase [Syntrophomonadaceae bacterium]
MDHLYPIYLRLKDVKCLVIGGGQVAERKVNSLLEAGARVRIVAPKITETLQEKFNQGEVEYASRLYQTIDLDDLETGKSLVFVATDDPVVNHQVYREGHARGLLVNVVDDPDHCSFFVPAVVRRGALCIAVSTEGKSPLLARRIREKMEGEYGPEYAEFLQLLGECRQQVLSQIADSRKRRAIFEQLVDSDLLALIKANKQDQVKERVSQCLSSWSD